MVSRSAILSVIRPINLFEQASPRGLGTALPRHSPDRESTSEAVTLDPQGDRSVRDACLVPHFTALRPF